MGGYMKFLRAFLRCCAIILAVLFGLVLVDCFISDDEDELSDSEGDTHINTQTSADLSSADRSRKISLNQDGTLSIERPQRSGAASDAADGTWTIFVYLCGTDLESEYGCATDNLIEMADTATDENIKFVVQTGGTYEWQNDIVDSSNIERYAVYGGDYYLVDEQPISDMGSSSTLADFLSWGIENYPAKHTGLILWNHGGGSLSGVCFDERYDYDSLLLSDIDEALLKVYDKMGDNFEFIGFDACLMSTVETANVLASYADYMYASQETEPGSGWDYAAIVSYLSEHPNADGAELGKVVADSYYEKNDGFFLGDTSDITMSVTDLSKIDNLTTLFNAYALDLYNASEDEGMLAEVERKALKVDNYGGNNRSVGYTNLIDLGGLIDAGAAFSEHADEVKSALSEAVIYYRNGSNHTSACGLSVYYPLEIQGSSELKTFGNVSVSPYYLALVDKVAYGAAHAGDISSYDSSDIIGLWEDNESCAGCGGTDNFDGYWDYYDLYEPTGESPLITFVKPPTLDADGNYGFILTQEAIQNTADVQACVFEVSEDEEDVIYLGNSIDIIADYDDGSFYDNFDGYWFSLPDGQNLSVDIISHQGSYCEYSSSVLLNGEETNLLFTLDYDTGNVTVEGTWDGIEDNGMASREVRKLKEGDELIPVYWSMSLSSDDEPEYTGIEYTVDNNMNISYDLLADGNYCYSFMIFDVYGDYYQTDFEIFNMENGTPYYYIQ